MLSLRSSGKILGPTSLTQLAHDHDLSPPVSVRELIDRLGIRGAPEINFQFGVHNLDAWSENNKANFQDGVPDPFTFKDTFGTAEVLNELLNPLWGHPVLTTAFYAFYHYFLMGKANGGLATGFCSALSSLVADKFWKGDTDAITLDKGSVHKFLTGLQGKMLSRESLITFHDQGREGAARIEKSFREVETTFLRGGGRQSAPLIFFLPSGAIWNDGYFDKLGESHCVLPYALKYPAGHSGPQLTPDGSTTVTDLHGVEMLVWDCNFTADKDCKIVFKDNGGEPSYTYSKKSGLNSQNGFTLGMMTNGKYLLSDHDMPFSGPEGLKRFIIDFLLSPADLQITDPNGRRTGNFGGLIHAEIPDSHPCFLAKGAYLLPLDAPLERRIEGTGVGQYTFNSIIPDSGSLVLQDVKTAPGQVDELSVNLDQTKLRFRPAAEKTFNLTLSRLNADEVRAITLHGVGGHPAAEVDISTTRELNSVEVNNRGAARAIDVRGHVLNRQTNQVQNKVLGSLNVPSQAKLKLQVNDWNTVSANLTTFSNG
jgi:hypothetical protein